MREANVLSTGSDVQARMGLRPAPALLADGPAPLASPVSEAGKKHPKALKGVYVQMGPDFGYVQLYDLDRVRRALRYQ
jgi:hypothetical protein